MGASPLSLLILLLLLLLLPLPPFYSLATAETNSSNLLQLSAGLNLSISLANSLEYGYLNSQGMWSVATSTLDVGGIFFPILSSPSFTTISSDSNAFGYSLGFYLEPISPPNDDIHLAAPPCNASGCNLYLAVSAGAFGKMGKMLASTVRLDGALHANATQQAATTLKSLNGFAVPVWIANLNTPIRYIDRASLTVQELVPDSDLDSTGARELQLRDGKNSVWRVRVSDADTMEMNDTGQLLIYNSASRSQPVWQSSPNTALVQGQRLDVGQELVSKDSSYVARMEKGGLVFYMNNTHFNRELQPPPYWLFPLYREAGDEHASLNQLISSAPCSNSPAHINPVTIEILFNAFALYPGSCSSNTTYLSTISDMINDDFSWMFWRLESDGMLYRYGVLISTSTASVTKSAINTYQISMDGAVDPVTPLALSWQDCSMPMACGPLGLCTQGAQPFCSCWAEPAGFEPVNTTNLFQGCKRSVDLPNCSTTSGGGINRTGRSTSFVQLNSTASILLFNEWTFNSTPGLHDVSACKESCLSECSCNGFFYEVSTSSCFFMTDEITLLQVVDTHYTSFQKQDILKSKKSTVLARNYVTFLKVAAEGPETGKRRAGKSRAGWIALAAIIASILVVCLVLAAAGYLFFTAKRKKYIVQNSNIMPFMQESKEFHDILPLIPNRFGYQELFEATQGFNKLLGAGGCGSVYAGLLSDGRKVAVKVLQVVLQGRQHSKQFQAEIATIGRTNHHNIVRLVGFCWEVSQRLLVYEYVERGSLDRWIFVKPVVRGNDDSPTEVEAPLLDWKTRYNVALGIARGLNYLHEECEKPILHFDIKPQNILLDNDFVAKLADFGMSRLIERDMSAVVTGMRGTPGYIAPEWCLHGSVSKKSDVYSMGMVLLEIVGGQKNVDFSLLKSSSDPTIDQDAWHFPTWAAKKCEQGLIMELIDHRLLQGSRLVDVAQALNLIHIAFWCIQGNPAMRPHAASVVKWLEEESYVEQPPFSVDPNSGRQPIDLLSTYFS